MTGNASIYGSNWLKGSAQVTGNLTAQELSQENNVIAFVCSWTNNAWKCGCRDSTCGQMYWQLQKFGNY
jgi:hypothetical protein